MHAALLPALPIYHMPVHSSVAKLDVLDFCKLLFTS